MFRCLACPPQQMPMQPQQQMCPPGMSGGFGGLPSYGGIDPFIKNFYN
jgi:hypothetical protein